MTNGLILVSNLSSRDSRTTNRGKDDKEVSVSESLSGQSRLDNLVEAIYYNIISSGVLPANPRALQGDVLRGNPFASATPGLHNGDIHLWECSRIDVKYCHSNQDIE